MKKRGLIIVIASVIFVLLCVSIFVVIAINRHNETAKQAEKDRQTEQEKSVEDATNKFKKLFKMDLPDGVKVNRYYYDSNDNFTLIDLVFEKDDYDSVFQTFQEKVVDREKNVIMIFQKELIYDPDDPDVFDFDDLPGLRRIPDELNNVCEEQVEIVDFIVGYYIDYIVTDGKDGRPQGFYDWIFAIDNKGLYHIMIKNWD